jgi:GTP cyclohydrolase II
LTGPDASRAVRGGPPLFSRLLARGGRADVQRAITEFLAARAVVVTDPERPPLMVLPVDGLTPGLLADLRALAPGRITLVLSGTRAAALGAPGMGSACIALPPAVDAERVLALAGQASVELDRPPGTGHRTDEAAVELAKLARLLPAVLVVADPAVAEQAAAEGAVSVESQQVLAFRAGHAASLRLVSRAPVPLSGASECEIVVFRDDLGEAWTLIRVGDPDPRRTVPVRLHSACLTGDAFGSMRCDCGDQLDMAIAMIDALGGGVLLYLNQEGCGIGLSNKMRAYCLQDQGLDTIDANTTLGFQPDERRYDAAARMLRMVGIERVGLLTNNPSKVDALRSAGIDVRDRIPLLAPVRGGNRRYLETKRLRAGHLIDVSAVLQLPEDA